MLPQFLSNIIQRARKWVVHASPNAARLWQLLGNEESHAYWMFAHPVHLLLGRDSFFLQTPAPVEVASDDAKALIESLNQHFSQQNLYFYLKQNTWFLGVDTDPKISLTPLKYAVGHDIRPYIPKGDGALVWASLQNEIQMLLFDHPVNLARESRKELPINSLWFDGLGRAE